MARSAGWRDRAAVDLVLGELRLLQPRGPTLVMEDPLPDLVRTLGNGAAEWHRRAVRGTAASPWPPAAATAEGFQEVFLRLPRAKEELEMAAHGAAHRLAPGGRLFVYGANDEGVKSAAGRLEPLFGPVATRATGGRCRLLEATRPEQVAGLRPGLLYWRIESPPPHPDIDGPGWVAYPGTFAAGRLDEGTELLLGVLPDCDEMSRVVDYGCGDGVVAGVLAGRFPGLRPVMLDVDAVALEAAAENVPAGLTALGDGWSALTSDPPSLHAPSPFRASAEPADTRAGLAALDAVVSNPPFHRGKAETMGMIRDLVLGAASRLVPGGTLTLVAQRRLDVGPLVEESFPRVEVLADGGAFRVWRGTAGPGSG